MKKKSKIYEVEPVEKAVEYVEKSGAMIAKRDFTISHNEYLRKIKAGEDVSDVPSVYHENLKTENVI